jgi:tetratricopeptide (TPR) repeat protein
MAEAIVLFRKATDLDPNFAQAWSGLSDAYRLQVDYAGVPSAEALPKAERAVRRALELDDQLAEAHASLGGLLLKMGDAPGARSELQRAIELNPNYAPAYNWLGLYFNSNGEFEKALESYATGLEIDPLSPVLNTNRVVNLGFLGRFDAMKTAAERMIEMIPESKFSYWNMFDYEYSVEGNIDRALVWATKVVATDPNDIRGYRDVAFAFMDLSDYQSAEYWTEKAAEIRAENVDVSSARVWLAVLRGDFAAALRYAREVESLSGNQLYDPEVLRILMYDDLARSQGDKALNRYKLSFPELLAGDEYSITRSNYYLVPDLVHLLRETGATDRADRMLQDLILVLDSIGVLGFAGYGPLKAVALAMAGETEAALSELKGAVEAGWRGGWWYVFDHHPLLEPLRDDPEFQSLRAQVAADIATQLENVRRMEASGELPTNWAQPPATTTSLPPS